MIRLKDFRDDDVWSLFEASASGDLPAVKRLGGSAPGTGRCSIQLHARDSLRSAGGAPGGDAVSDQSRGGDSGTPFLPVS